MEQTLLWFLLCAAKYFPKQRVSFAVPGTAEQTGGEWLPGLLGAQGHSWPRGPGDGEGGGRLAGLGVRELSAERGGLELGKPASNLAWLVLQAGSRACLAGAGGDALEKQAEPQGGRQADSAPLGFCQDH